MKLHRSVTAFMLAAFILTLVGCGGTGGTGGNLEGINWALESYDSGGVMKDAPAGITATALFEGGSVGGFSGVNTYSGPYKASGSELSIGNLASTMMAGPPELMDFEQAYLSALQDVSSFSADGGGLALLDEDGRELLVFAEAKQRPLTGSTWTVTSFYNGRDAVTGVLNGTTLTAIFSEDGTLSGSTGINDYKSEYTVDGKKISISSPATVTANDSEDPAVVQQQSDFLAALTAADTFEVTGNRLDLLRADGGFAVTLNLE